MCWVAAAMAVASIAHTAAQSPAERVAAELEAALRATPKPTPAHHGKCDSCGSREFKRHRGHTVCAYCRGGA